jgi:vacuolar-type H+-ATPase subunit I/STV1
VIVRMIRVRIAGLRALLDRTLATLQDLAAIAVARTLVERKRRPRAPRLADARTGRRPVDRRAVGNPRRGAREPADDRPQPRRAGVLPSPGDASGHDAAREFETLVEQVLTAAPQEHMMRRLGQALSHTTRLVNTLEQRVAVRLSEDLAEMRRTLAEREREEHLRIKRSIAQRVQRQPARSIECSGGFGLTSSATACTMVR